MPEPIGDAKTALAELLGLLTNREKAEKDRRDALVGGGCLTVFGGLALFGALTTKKPGGPGELGGWVCVLVSLGGGILTLIRMWNPMQRPQRSTA